MGNICIQPDKPPNKIKPTPKNLRYGTVAKSAFDQYKARVAEQKLKRQRIQELAQRNSIKLGRAVSDYQRTQFKGKEVEAGEHTILEKSVQRGNEQQRKLQLQREQKQELKRQVQQRDQLLRKQQQQKRANLKRIEEDSRQDQKHCNKIQKEQHRISKEVSEHRQQGQVLKKIRPVSQYQFGFNPLLMLMECTTQNQPHLASCHFCREQHFHGHRAVCLVCKNVSYCSDCFQQIFEDCLNRTGAKRKAKVRPSHDPQHPFVYFGRTLNEKGSSRLLLYQEMFRLRSVEERKGVSWTAWCEVCCELKESVFLSSIKEGSQVCKKCFELNSDSPDASLYLAELFPQYNQVQSQLYHFRTSADDPAILRSGGHSFQLVSFQFRISPTLYKLYEEGRNRLLRVKSARVVEVYAYQQAFERDLVRVVLIQESGGKQVLSLDRLIGSMDYAAFSLRRKFGIMRSMAAGLSKMHSRGIVLRQLDPTRIRLDQYHEAKLVLLPFANQYVAGNSVYREPQGEEDEKSDIYSFGLLLNYVLTGCEHTTSKGKTQFRKRSFLFGKVIDNCLAKKELRPSSQEVEEYFEQFEARFWHRVDEEMGRQAYQTLTLHDKDLLFERTYKSHI